MSYAYYRLPYTDTYKVIRSEREDRILTSYEQIGMDAGFVIAPFLNARRTPIVLIHPDEEETSPIPSRGGEYFNISPFGEDKSGVSAQYERAFTVFHDAILEGNFMKLVLSRTFECELPDVEPESLFLEACRRYPRLMIMLVSTPATGTWLVASPEILLTGDDSWWHTMALAGTMPYEDGYQVWDEKNRQEQHFVEAYIEDRLTDFSIEILKDGPHTKRAGNLVHLCTDFRFHIADGCYIGEVIASLHPTPAVCGIPKMKARDFILFNENTKREYYSGFMGPVNIDSQTHLYVSLRCAQLKNRKAILYAGGGIMHDSTLQSEWDETENKMKTIGQTLPQPLS